MPSISKQTATEKDYGVVVDRSGEMDGYTVNIVTMVEPQDMTGMLSSLPGGQCHCPHWGYVFSGRMTVRYDDSEETVEAGDAFYMPPGHVPTYEAGTELVQFSPTDQLAETEAAIMKFMQGGQGA
jgi:mannose-6-phosphate isomerase-like protein (cupin superfamily)